jgi:hypothetical protein
MNEAGSLFLKDFVVIMDEKNGMVALACPPLVMTGVTETILKH